MWKRRAASVIRWPISSTTLAGWCRGAKTSSRCVLPSGRSCATDPSVVSPVQEVTGPIVIVHPAPAPDNLIAAWEAALDDAGIAIGDVALIWRAGRPRPTGQQAASWRSGSMIDPEFDDDDE